MTKSCSLLSVASAAVVGGAGAQAGSSEVGVGAGGDGEVDNAADAGALKPLFLTAVSPKLLILRSLAVLLVPRLARPA